jgi:hypothetical protein
MIMLAPALCSHTLAALVCGALSLSQAASARRSLLLFFVVVVFAVAVAFAGALHTHTNEKQPVRRRAPFSRSLSIGACRRSLTGWI